MQTFNLMFKDSKDQMEFIKKAETKHYDIDISYGDFYCDGKSYMALVTSIPCKAKIKAEFNSDDENISEDFKQWIN